MTCQRCEVEPAFHFAELGRVVPVHLCQACAVDMVTWERGLIWRQVGHVYTALGALEVAGQGVSAVPAIAARVEAEAEGLKLAQIVNRWIAEHRADVAAAVPAC